MLRVVCAALGARTAIVQALGLAANALSRYER